METRDPTSDDPKSTGMQPSPSPSPVPRPTYTRAPASNPNFSSLPPLMTTAVPRAAPGQRKPSYATKRLSAFSNNSAGLSMSRPQSSVFPFFLSSLPYALVRDFAYPPYHQLHYGPPPDSQSSVSTPASEISRRVSDPHGTLRGSGARGMHLGNQDANDMSYFGLQLPARSFGDGPPYAEDEDLLSPIVTTTKHKKTRSNLADYESSSSRRRSEATRAASRLADGGSSLGHLAQPSAGMADDDLVSPLTADEQAAWRRRPREDALPHDPNNAPELHISSTSDDYSPSDPPSDDLDDADGSRLSRAYQFTIASPDEEYHGKAVALFDFARENDNELPFFEGQVLWVSYRHGEGWLVAQDPKSGESGLIPEEYVRLLRDIEGGLSGLKGDEVGDEDADLDTPVELRKATPNERFLSGGGVAVTANGEHYAPVLSHFTTSSKDLEPYSLSQSYSQQLHQPPNLQQPPPQYQQHILGSQQSTPIAATPSQFDAKPQEPPSLNTTVTEDDGGVVLLSPETFKREDLNTTKREQTRVASERESEQDILKGNVHMDTAAVAASPTTTQRGSV